ncbi:sensor histidine kinase [Seonamhaeicola maritimus]|uniref:sensor histidine kinase n=1 Tax=Seonamhaeicola maritimus TaxID=2591822 RepID=UPI002494D751|nr:sensor histidine kinase [Seonamhaeicola maritimus]
MQRIAQNDGTDFNHVQDITQDADGFMWFATNRGLFKYDGNQLYAIKKYTSNSEEEEEEGVIRIKTVYADADGMIWIGTFNEGLDRYNSKTGKFTHYGHDPDDPTSLANDNIIDILRDSKGTLWIATNNGLDQFNPKTNGFIHFQPKNGDSTSLSDYRVRCLYEDKQGTLWVGTGIPWVTSEGHEPEYGGLNRYNRETKTFTQYRSQPNDSNSLNNNKITSVFEDNKGILWVTTHKNGLYQMDREKGTFKLMEYDPEHPEVFGNPESEFANETVNFISQDPLGNYWIGKNNSGLYYFNASKGEIINTNALNVGTGNIGSGKVSYTSPDGTFWVGSARKGYVFYANLLPKKIPSPFTSSEWVNVLYEEQDGTFWIGKVNELVRVDIKKRDTLSFKSELNFKPDSTNAVRNIVKDSNGDLWVGASTGLFKWDALNQTFTGYLQNPKNDDFLNLNSVHAIFEDSQQNFWVGTFDGLYLLERSTGKFTHLEESETYSVTDLMEDNAGDIWFTSWSRRSGIMRYNPSTKTIRSYQSSLRLSSVFQDSRGVIWVGGPNAILTYDSERDDFFPLNKSNALSDFTSISKMEEDHQKNLWVTTGNAIVKINPERNQTSVYGHNFGIEPRSLSFRGIHKGVNGDLFFGHNNGYYQIDPTNFPENAKPSKVFFTRLLLFNEEVHPSSKGLLKQPLQHTKTIKLPYRQNVFSIDFSIIDYQSQEDNKMMYFLENYDNDWIGAKTNKRASYYDIKPGNYVFHIKGHNSDGIWAENNIEIIILPPWYQSWVAYIIYGLLLIASLFGFDRFQRKRIINRERQKNQERELAQAKEIEKAYTELKSTQAQLIQSEKMASLGELTAGIAHEIQNPLNFVNNFSEVSNELIDEMHEEIQKEDYDEVKAIASDLRMNLEKINHHGKRADAIVKGMLQHSRSGSHEKEPTDINKLADEYFRLAYHGLRAKDKSFNATMESDYDDGIGLINIFPQDMGRVILNLITNAFYTVHKKKGTSSNDYAPTVSLKTKKESEFVKLEVSDNGNGIPKGVLNKIFQPFFTTKPTGEGTGLGLSLSYDIVKTHGGDLQVETKEGQGTTFTLLIPHE